MEKIKLNNESLYQRFDKVAIQDKKLSDTLSKVRSTFSDKLDHKIEGVEGKIQGVEGKINEIETNMNIKFEDMNVKFDDMKKVNEASVSEMRAMLQQVLT